MKLKDKEMPPKDRLSPNINQLLNSCIRIEPAINNRGNTIPQQIRFNLNIDVLTWIDRARAENIRLTLSPANLADLQYYLLLNCPVEQISWEYPGQAFPAFRGQFSTLRRSCLTFSTDYADSIDRSPKTVFRSSIDPRGAISQQIERELWQDRQLLSRISQAHYWLVAEILDRSPLQRKTQPRWAIAGFSLVIAGIFTIVIQYFFSLNIWFNLLIFTCLLPIFNSIFKNFILKHIKNLIMHDLVKRQSSKSLKIRRLKFKIFSLLS